MCSGGSSIDDRSVSNDIQRAAFSKTTEGNVMKISTWPRRMFSSRNSKLFAIMGLATAALTGCAFVAVVILAVFTVSVVNCVGGSTKYCSVAISLLTTGGGGVPGALSTLGKPGVVWSATQETIKQDPPAADLYYFDASQASASVNLANLTLLSDGGTATITITDESTGSVLGSETFPFTINGSSAAFTDPSAVNQWVRSFSSYPGNVSVNTQFYVATTTPGTGQSGTVQITAEYSGSPYLSGSAAIFGPPNLCNGKPSPYKCAP